MKLMNNMKKYYRTHEYYQKKAKNLNKLKQISKSQTHSRVHLAGRVEKQEDGKVGGQKKFYFLSFFVWLRVEKQRDKKYEFE